LGWAFLSRFSIFGVQIAAAPFFPDYSFSRDASTLGSNGSTLPTVFNIGSYVVGMVAFIASWGFFHSLPFPGVRPGITWLATLALVSSAI
jgi:hypothetical protein